MKTVSAKKVEEFLDIKIEVGVQKGLVDVEAGRIVEMTPDFIKEWTNKLKAKYSIK